MRLMTPAARSIGDGLIMPKIFDGKGVEYSRGEVQPYLYSQVHIVIVGHCLEGILAYGEVLVMATRV